MPLNLDNLPSRRDEAWKWTDVHGRVTEGQSGLSVEGQPKFIAPKGVSISQSAGSVSETPMAKLAQNVAPQSWEITVPADFADGEALHIEDISRGHLRVDIKLGKSARLTVIEHHSGDAGAFVNLDMQIHLAEGANLTRVIVHDDPSETVRIATATIHSQKNARFNQFALSFGGGLTRLETRLNVMGEGFEANMNGAYLLGEQRHCDMSSHIDLERPDCTIRQAVKGVVTDKARGVFQGKFLVQRPAQHTDAEMRHDALMLSESSEIRSKPELEIYADDVACAHGNTIGQLDESALFYMQQRGIPIGQARALLTEAFLADVFDDLDDEDLKDSILDKIRGWLRTVS
ncbi:MAG: Fe-S cluster assembly protein SufD [Litorimonas sp.]